MSYDRIDDNTSVTSVAITAHEIRGESTTPTVPAPVLPSPLEKERSEDNAEYDSDYPWHVVLIDDNQHTYDYVIEMLGSIFGYNLPKAFAMACEVDSRGRVIVATCHLEVAEMRQSQIQSYGADWRIPSCKGSMTAVLEQAR
jgi:ATP-dependent Clp protease adaptor protein ClpS